MTTASSWRRRPACCRSPRRTIVTKWRLQPGKMLLIDIEKGRIVSDEEIKAEIADRHPYKQWLDNTQLILEDLSPVEPRALRKDVTLLDRQQAFGYTQEDTRLLMSPMATIGQEAVGSMGTDTPISAMSDKSKLLYTYFKQNFAQVTNPPIDPIREELVMSLVSFIGPRPNIFDLVGNSRLKRLEVRQPILTNGDLEKIRSIGHVEDRFDTKTLDVTYEAEKGAAGHAGGGRAAVQPRRDGGRRRLQHHHPVRPAGRAGPHRDPVAAGDGRRAPSPDPQGPAHLGRAGGGIGRAARSASFLLPCRLRRRGDQPLPCLRYAARHAQARRDAEGGRRLRGRLPLHQVDRQGHPEGDVQDGHLDLPVLLRRPDLRRGRPVQRLRRQILHRHRHDDRGRRAGGDRRGDRAAPHQRVRQRSGAEERARIRRRICAAAARREPCLVVGNRLDAAACGAQGLVRDVRRIFEAGEPRGGARADHPRPVQDQDGGRHRAPAGGARRRRAGQGDRQAVLDRRDVVRLDLAARRTPRWRAP